MLLTVEDVKKQIGKKIRDARKAKGLTLKELGEKMGFSESLMSRYEGGKINFTVDSLQRFASELEVVFEINIGER